MIKYKTFVLLIVRTWFVPYRERGHRLPLTMSHQTMNDLEDNHLIYNTFTYYLTALCIQAK